MYIISHVYINSLQDAIFSYKLRYIVGFWLVEMAISTNQEPSIYRNLYENTGPVFAKNTIYWEYNEAVLFDYH